MTQAGPEFTVQVRMALNFGSPRPHLSSAGVTAQTTTQGLCRVGDGPQVLVMGGKQSTEEPQNSFISEKNNNNEPTEFDSEQLLL